MAASGFGQRVFQARMALSAARGKTVTQADVAREMGVVGVTVGRWEAGLKEPDLATIERLAVVLDTDPAWLAFGLIVAPLKEAPPGTPGSIPVQREIPAQETPAIPESPPRSLPEVSRHKKAPLTPIKKDQGKGRRRAGNDD